MDAGTLAEVMRATLSQEKEERDRAEEKLNEV